jgi:hypothetical protein
MKVDRGCGSGDNAPYALTSSKIAEIFLSKGMICTSKFHMELWLTDSANFP